MSAPGFAGPGAPVRSVGTRLGEAVSGRASFLLLGVVVAAVLLVGAVHPSAPTAAQRIAHLEQILKCPSCADESIAQSSATPAVGLRLVVREMVRAGRSDEEIEQYAIARYGEGEILVPNGGITTLEWALPLGALVLAAGALLYALLRRRTTGASSASAEDEALVAAARAPVSR